MKNQLLQTGEIGIFALGGVDFTYLNMSKASGIQKCLEHESDYRLISVGDGANDIDLMIRGLRNIQDYENEYALYQLS